jgi:RHS repeat-associated protein
VRQLVDENGSIILGREYDPYGNLLGSEGEAETMYGFDAEQTDYSLNLINLRARLYSPSIGRFFTRDLWQGDYNRPLSLNRWTFVEGNPLSFTDSSGHAPYGERILAEFRNEDERNTHYSSHYENENKDTLGFTSTEMDLVESALMDVARAYALTYNEYGYRERANLYCLPPEIRIHFGVRTTNPIAAFLTIHGGRIKFYKYEQDDLNTVYLGETESKNVIRIYPNGDTNTGGEFNYGYVSDWQGKYKRFIVHETGHAFDNAIGLEGRVELGLTELITDTDISNISVDQNNGFYGTQGQGWQRRGEVHKSEHLETFADMFIGWVYKKWEINPMTGNWTDLGIQRSEFMNQHMPGWIISKLGNPIYYR